MNSEKHYHEEYNINNYNLNYHSSEWHNQYAGTNTMNNYLSPSDDIEFLFNSRYSDVEQYQILQQSDSANYNQTQYNENNELNILDVQNKWNEEEQEFQSSEKQQIQEDQEQNKFVSFQAMKLRSQQALTKQYSNRSHSASSECSIRDNSSSQEKSSSSNKFYSNEESSSIQTEEISHSKKKNYAQNEESSFHDNSRFAKNKQSQHKNVVKNIGLGFKNYLIDSKSPLNERIQNILKENRLTHFEFRQWINQSVKLDQKKEIYKALNIKQEDSQKIQNFKRILSSLFSIFFEEHYASSYLWKNNNIQNKDIHIQFIKHFIQSSRDTDYLLKKWK